MKAFKRNAVIVTVILFVCVAAYLNWVYGRNVPPDMEVAGDEGAYPSGEAVVAPENSPESDSAGLYFEQSSVSAIFAETRLTRQQARDAAVETLATVQNATGASQEIVDSALTKITEIASYSQKEVEIEALIRAKGFADCVVFISGDGVKVTVPAPVTGLSAVDVAKITDVVTTETEFTAAQLKVIEVKDK